MVPRTELERPHETSIAHIAPVFSDYDESIDCYTKKLNFELIEDPCQVAQDKRWVIVSPPNSSGTSLLLARAATAGQREFVGNQSGGRVFLYLSTDVFWRDFEKMNSDGIRFVREPKEADHGTVAGFADLYGNLWDLIEFKT